VLENLTYLVRGISKMKIITCVFVAVTLLAVTACAGGANSLPTTREICG